MKSLLSTMAAAVATIVVAAPLAHAGGFQLFPILHSGYELAPAVAVVGGYADPDVAGVTGSGIYGVELSIACPLLKTPANGIRQQISLTRFDHRGLRATALELNPHYRVEVAPNLAIGAGPALGVIWTDLHGESDTVLGAGLGASAEYRLGGHLFAGLEARALWTTEADAGAGTDTGVNSVRSLVKLGYRF